MESAIASLTYAFFFYRCWREGKKNSRLRDRKANFGEKKFIAPDEYTFISVIFIASLFSRFQFRPTLDTKVHLRYKKCTLSSIYLRLPRKIQFACSLNSLTLRVNDEPYIHRR